ncbi:MAG: hypothetical protein VB092_09375 [Oscillospiraceae bacterium]|nr:hypothetical protein [Oscillospiraceae bacterium]
MLYDEGCDYLVVSEYMMPGFTVGERFGTLVFENADARIYALKSYE